MSLLVSMKATRFSEIIQKETGSDPSLHTKRQIREPLTHHTPLIRAHFDAHLRPRYFPSHSSYFHTCWYRSHPGRKPSSLFFVAHLTAQVSILILCGCVSQLGLTGSLLFFRSVSPDPPRPRLSVWSPHETSLWFAQQ